MKTGTAIFLSALLCCITGIVIVCLALDAEMSREVLQAMGGFIIPVGTCFIYSFHLVGIFLTVG